MYPELTIAVALQNAILDNGTGQDKVEKPVFDEEQEEDIPYVEDDIIDDYVDVKQVPLVGACKRKRKDSKIEAL